MHTFLPLGGKAVLVISLAQFFTLEKCSRAPGQRAELWLLYRPLCTEVTPANTFPSAILLKGLTVLIISLVMKTSAHSCC